MSKKIFLIAGIALLLLAIGVDAYYFIYKKSVNLPDPHSNQNEFVVKTKQIPNSQLPTGFPDTLPVEAGSKVLQNYEATTDDGRHQSTRVISTAKTPDAAAADYQNFFVGQGWSVVTGAAKGTVLLRKGDDTLLINATQQPSLGTTVELTLTKAK